MSLHQLTFRHSGPEGTALCSCGKYIRGEDLPHGRVDLDIMLAYLDVKLGDRPRREFPDGSGYMILNP